MRALVWLLALALPLTGCIDAIGDVREDLEANSANDEDLEQAGGPADTETSEDDAGDGAASTDEDTEEDDESSSSSSEEDDAEDTSEDTDEGADADATGNETETVPAPEPRRLSLTFTGVVTGAEGACPAEEADCDAPSHVVRVPAWATGMEVILSWTPSNLPDGTPAPTDLDPVLLSPTWCDGSSVQDQDTSTLCEAMGPRLDQDVIPQPGVYRNDAGTPAEPDNGANLALSNMTETGDWTVVIWPKEAVDAQYTVEIIVTE